MEGAVNHQCRHLTEIAQFQERPTDNKAAVEIINFILHQLDGAACILQTALASNNAYIIPHKTP